MDYRDKLRKKLVEYLKDGCRKLEEYQALSGQLKDQRLRSATECALKLEDTLFALYKEGR
jgi:hypothetical protein